MRELVAKSFMHLILYHLDLDVWDKIFHFPIQLSLENFDASDFSEYRNRKIDHE